MEAPIAQIVALTCHANAFLQGREIGPFFPNNSTCAFCCEVEFVRWRKHWFSLSGSFKEIPVARDPDSWFANLRQNNCRSVRLHHRGGAVPNSSDRESAGFVGGGGHWLMEAGYDRGSDYWEGRWSLWNQDDPKPWRVTYGLIPAAAKTSADPPLSLVQVRPSLVHALTEIRDFALAHNLSSFAERFSRAMECLSSAEPLEHVYHKDLSRPGFLPLDLVQILAAVQTAWVFGGMGSWNDLGFSHPDQETYEAVSDELFRQLTAAICQTVNAVAGDEESKRLFR